MSNKGLWKWDHYFDIYDRHLSRFRNCEIRILEIGVLAGGSLELWKEYFGAKAHIYGVDKDPACRVHEDRQTTAFIGDQSDLSFWQGFRKTVPSLDIVIDDGSHKPDHQLISLNELLPLVSYGGVYLCEDIHSADSPFSSRFLAMAAQLHSGGAIVKNARSPERNLVTPTTALQASLDSITIHPFTIVIAKRSSSLHEFVAPRRGTFSPSET